MAFFRYTTMRLLTFFMTAALLATLCVPAHADEARAAYKRGVQFETHNKYDEAFQEFKQAYQLKPKDAEYLAAYSRMRFYAAAEHVRLGSDAAGQREIAGCAGGVSEGRRH